MHLWFSLAFLPMYGSRHGKNGMILSHKTSSAWDKTGYLETEELSKPENKPRDYNSIPQG
jgi:hypothetical protein